MENQISNMQKYDNYREIFGKLKRAMASEFYYEAIFLEYSIMEDRTESILKYAEKWDAYLKKHRRGNPEREPTMESKIKYIKGQIESGNKLLNKYFGDDLLDRIIVWKEDRNTLIHALLNQQLNNEAVAEIALTGEKLTKELRNKSTNFNRAVERKNKAIKG